MDTVEVLRALAQLSERISGLRAEVAAHARRERRRTADQIGDAAGVSGDTVRRIARAHGVPPAPTGRVAGLTARSPAVAAIARAIAADITSGALHPGDPAPTSAHIRAEHHVTGKTAHAVLAALARAHYITDPDRPPALVLDPDPTTLPPELLAGIDDLATAITTLREQLTPPDTTDENTTRP